MEKREDRSKVMKGRYKQVLWFSGVWIPLPLGLNNEGIASIASIESIEAINWKKPMTQAVHCTAA